MPKLSFAQSNLDAKDDCKKFLLGCSKKPGRYRSLRGGEQQNKALPAPQRNLASSS
jgi:hypothetical protein